MKNTKILYLFPILYALFITVAGNIVGKIYNITYGEPAFIAKLLPILMLAVLIAGVCFYFQRQNLDIPWTEKGKVLLYLPYIVPLLGSVLYYWSIKGEMSVSFFIPILATFFIGIGEELVSRRVLFIGLLKEYRFAKALLVSSAVFGVLHGLNVFSGMPIKQAFIQVIMTFIAGVFLTLMYDYTKSFYLVAFQHWLWDYLLLSGAAKENQFLALMVIAIVVIQILLVITLLIRKFRK